MVQDQILRTIYCIWYSVFFACNASLMNCGNTVFDEGDNNTVRLRIAACESRC